MTELVQIFTDLPTYLTKRSQCQEFPLDGVGSLSSLDSLDEGLGSVITRLLWLHPDGKIGCKLQLLCFNALRHSGNVVVLTSQSLPNKIYLFGWIQSSKTGGQLYSDTAPY